MAEARRALRITVQPSGSVAHIQMVEVAQGSGRPMWRLLKSSWLEVPLGTTSEELWGVLERLGDLLAEDLEEGTEVTF